MRPDAFIAGHLRFKGKMAVISMTVSFLVVVLALAVSGGFRHAIRGGIRDLSGDVQLAGPHAGDLQGDGPVRGDSTLCALLSEVPGVRTITPVVYRPGIVRVGDRIQGILLKGVPAGDSLSLQVRIPRRLSEQLGLREGDEMLTYFVGERVQVRRFRVKEIYSGLVEADGKLLVYAPISDLQRLALWEPGEVSALEVTLSGEADEAALRRAAVALGAAAAGSLGEDDTPLVATASPDRYPALFDWLSLIDFNVLVILLLMIVVAGFNMISGLLILLFRHISTIGTLKTLGMSDRSIAAVFLRVSARVVLTGMAAGNAIALLFCLVQDKTHALRLNPANYFVSYVPVHVDLPMLLAVNAGAFAAIMLLLLLPCLFIARIDPADTVRVK
ncbi:MAG: ABC transporter permease [Bacteroidales bacterium]|nr:ABC transporter permease [Bacteroidales bacterium]